MIARLALVIHRFAVDAHPSDGVGTKTSKIALRRHVSSIMLVGYFSHSVASI
jgi:hypothetical protein